MTDNRTTDPEVAATGAETPGTDTPTETDTPAEAATTQVYPVPAPAPAPAPTAEPAQERGMRVGTVVWGLVVAAIGVGLLAVAVGVVFDVELAFIALVAAAGVLLLVGSVAGIRRRRT